MGWCEVVATGLDGCRFGITRGTRSLGAGRAGVGSEGKSDCERTGEGEDDWERSVSFVRADAAIPSKKKVRTGN